MGRPTDGDCRFDNVALQIAVPQRSPCENDQEPPRGRLLIITNVRNPTYIALLDFAFFDAFFIFLAEAFAAGSWTWLLPDMVGAVPDFGAFVVV